MANALFESYRNLMLGPTGATQVNLADDTIKLVFVDHATYTPDTTTDAFLSDITAGARTPTGQTGPTLGTKTIGSVGVGVFDAADTVFTSLSNGSVSVESLLLYKATGTDSSSDLCAYWDTATGLPLTPNGADVTVVWASGGIIAD